ncbi:MAG TPA: DUF2846 domain-containing protein [Spirochaetia bacterium]|nr:DUF2846 domain-containing protein [Spirochaetia bacterium]
MHRPLLLLPVVLVVLAGCVTYTPPAPSPFAPAASDAQGKQFTPPQGKGYLYISRPDEFRLLGKATPYGITVDGKDAGGIMPGMYFCFALDPGHHTFSVSCQDSADSAGIQLQAGKSWYYQISTDEKDNRVKVSLGWVILEPMGKMMINNTKRGQAAFE